MIPSRRSRASVLALIAVLAVSIPATSASARGRPAAASWIVIDNATGEVLSSHKPDLPLFPASLTKMLTAQVVFDNSRLSDRVRIGPNAANAPADHVRWPLGKTFTVEQMLYGMMLMSSNGAAIALAEHIAGTVQSFTSLMQFKARGLGITLSTWTTPEGLDAQGQLATARDLAVVARSLLGYPVLAKIVRTRDYTVGGMRLRARNHFLFNYPGAIGVKPGYTTHARSCLAAAAERGGRTIIAVVMRTSTPTTDAAMLLDDAFARAPAQPKRRTLKVYFAPLAQPPVQPTFPPAEATIANRVQPRDLGLGLIAYFATGMLLCGVAFLPGLRHRRGPGRGSAPPSLPKGGTPKGPGQNLSTRRAES